MNKHLKMVRDFHDAFNFKQQPHGEPRELTRIERIMRLSLMQEEYAEILRAVAARNKIGVLDGLVDLSYFALGTLAMIGEDVLSGELSFEEWDSDYVTLLDLVMCETSKSHLETDSCTVMSHEKESDYSYLIETVSAVYLLSKHLAVQWLQADFDKAFEIVQASNMSKLGEDGKPIYDAAGKIRKGPNFVEPDLSLTFFDSEIDWVSLA